MKKDEIKRLTEAAMKGEFLPVPSHEGLENAKFELDDVKSCFSKSALIRNFIYLVGGVAIHGKGSDVDIVIAGEDLSENQKEAVLFRLYRAFGDYFNIPYDETPNHLHITFNNTGVYTNNIKLYDLAIVPSGDKEVHEMSGITLVKSTDENICFGYASVPVEDLEGDEITYDALNNMFEEMKSTPTKFLNVMNEHEGVQVGELLLEWNNLKTHVDKKGFFIIVKLRKDLNMALRAWEGILKGEIRNFSIHIEYPLPIEECTQKVCVDGRCWRKITKVRFVEVSFTSLPANLLCILDVPKDICEKDERCILHDN
ncbi:MAG: HK97 family phage prohead protease [Halanaerobiales bacterium]|nr:HK97 family phage prohead protease [Halanaerobiales bacterium]